MSVQRAETLEKSKRKTRHGKFFKTEGYSKSKPDV